MRLGLNMAFRKTDCKITSFTFISQITHYNFTKKERGASTTPLSRFHYKLYLTKLNLIYDYSREPSDTYPYCFLYNYNILMVEYFIGL